MILLVSTAAAQLSTTATITGMVTDSTGAVIPGASIAIKNLGTEIVTNSVSNSAGGFVAPGLNVGSYTVKITKDGFATFTFTECGVELHPAVTNSVNSVLNVLQGVPLLRGALPRVPRRSLQCAESYELRHGKYHV